MTVKELIEALQAQDPELEVWLCVGNFGAGRLRRVWVDADEHEVPILELTNVVEP